MPKSSTTDASRGAPRIHVVARSIFLAVYIVLLQSCASTSVPEPEMDVPTYVLVKTSMGDFTLLLKGKEAPVTVKNFLAYVDSGSFDNTLFHRVIPNFVVQGGGFDAEFRHRPTRPPIPNEAHNGLKNSRGTVAMARTHDPHSARSQFFVNLSDNHKLDHSSTTVEGFGYCVFAEVTDGMDVVDSISKVHTRIMNGHHDVPVKNILIISISRVR